MLPVSRQVTFKTGNGEYIRNDKLAPETYISTENLILKDDGGPWSKQGSVSIGAGA
jgi:hypothetical protein